MSRSFFSHLIAIVCFIAAALGLYGVKYQVKEVHEKVELTQRNLLEERKALRVAAAEWAYLSRPDRLAQLSDKYLSASAPVAATQVNEVASLPNHPAMQYASTTEAAPQGSAVVSASYGNRTITQNVVPVSQRMMTEE